MNDPIRLPGPFADYDAELARKVFLWLRREYGAVGLIVVHKKDTE